MRAAHLPWVLLVTWSALACGGRFDQNPTTGSAGSSPGAAGSSGSGGGGSDGVSGGGTTVDMPPTTCPCDPIACPPDYMSVPNPNGCCTQCAIDLAACEKTQTAYINLRQQLIAHAQTLTCMTDADCMIFVDDTGCSPTCGVALPHVAGRGVDDPLGIFASANCNPDCPTGPEPPCLPPAAPQCIANHCQ